MAEAAPVAAFSGHAQPITSLANAQYPPRVLSGSADGRQRLWNLADGKVMQQVGPRQPGNSCGRATRRTRFATAGAGGVAKLWNGADGKLVAEMHGEFRAHLQTAAAERTVADRTRNMAHFTAAVAASEKTATSETEGVKKATEALAAAEKARHREDGSGQESGRRKGGSRKGLDRGSGSRQGGRRRQGRRRQSHRRRRDGRQNDRRDGGPGQSRSRCVPGNKFLADAKAAGEKAVAEATAQIAASKEAKVAAEKAVVESPAKVKAAADALAAKVKAATDGDAARKQSETAYGCRAGVGRIEYGRQARRPMPCPLPRRRRQQARKRSNNRKPYSRKAKQAATTSEQPIRAIAFSPDNVQLATSGDDRLVHLWAPTAARHSRPMRDTAPVLAVAFAGDGRRASARPTNRLPYGSYILLGPGSGQSAVRTATCSSTGSPRSTSIPDGKLLASGSGEPSRGGELKIWNVADGTLAREIADAHSDTIFGLDFSPDGKYLASCGADKFVKVFDLASGKLAKAFEGHTHHVLTVAWQSQGRVLASGGADNVIKVWNFETGEQLRTIGGFAKEVTAVAFVGTGDETISCTGDKLVHLYQTDNGKKVRDFGGASDFMYAAAITPDGKLLVAGGQDSAALDGPRRQSAIRARGRQALSGTAVMSAV